MARAPLHGVSIGPGTLMLTALVLVAFASNSLLTRVALGAREIDAASFTSIRLVSGAVALALVVRVQRGAWTAMRGRGAVGPLALFAYAAPFSFAYLRIGAAVGALVLFGTVQLTMIGYGIARGERPSALAWTGIVLALLGFFALTLPSASRPDAIGAALMMVAGVAWAVYTIAGRGAPDPIAANARSFLLSAPLALLVSVASSSPGTASGRGIALALVSGAVTSGLGYAGWYLALPALSVTQAAVAQLSVPVIAAAGAVALLSERMTGSLALAGAAVLTGVALVLASATRRQS